MSKTLKKTQEETLKVITDAPKLEYSADDLNAPRLNVVQASSKIAGETGSLVVDKLHTLIEHEQECKCIPLKALKGWREDTPYGHPEMPRQVFNQDASEELAAASDWPIVKFAEIMFLFPKMDGGDDDAYPYPIGDEFYAMGKINVAKDAYKHTLERLATFQAFNPEAPLCSKYWKFKTELLTRGMNSWFVPSITPTTEGTPEETQTFAARLG